MQHRTHADARAEVGGARRQIAVAGIIRVFQFLLQARVKPVDLLPNLLDLHARQERLHTEMVLFVDHYTERFVLVQHQRTATTLGSMFTANQVAFHQ